MSKRALAQIAKSSGLRFSKVAGRADASVELRMVGDLALLLPKRKHRMGYGVDLDRTHSCAEIGERLGASQKPKPEPPEGPKKQIGWLRELEKQSPSAAAERWDKVRR